MVACSPQAGGGFRPRPPPGEGMTTPEPDPLVAFIAAQPDLAPRLMRAHVVDANGRCVVCALGAQAGRQRWPCAIYARARQALDYAVARADRRDRATCAGRKR